MQKGSGAIDLPQKLSQGKVEFSQSTNARRRTWTSRGRLREEQIIGVLKHAEAAVKAAETTCRQYGK
jgi:hypothetical protein